jgi:signal transduction histidine kinase/ligand-binding sensor domain-containing protein/CheY-like chemotaxis protein/HPt (histidine-containing phosphotransfer) domain-containing protein
LVNKSRINFMHRRAVSTYIHARGPRWIQLLGLLCSLTAPLAQAAIDAPPLILDHLTTSDGLPQGTVLATLQDSQGFVWLGTEDGLVRYDGLELVRYAYSSSARGGLPGNFINEIAEDAHHDLWIAIKDAGVARWNRASDSFTVYRHDPAKPDSLASDAARAILVDARGRIWIGTSDAGIDILEPATGHFEHLRHDPANADSLIDDRIFTLMLDRSGSLWVGTQTGLDRWQGARGVFNHFRHVAEDPHSLSANQISRVLEDQSGALWVGTYDGGLNQIDRNGRVLQIFRHDPKRPTSLSNDDVRAILEDQAGHLWVGTADGLNLLDRTTGGFTHYAHEASDADSLRDSLVQSLYEDATGLVWIGTREGGVSRWNPHSWELGGHRPDWLGGKDVTAFADAPNNKVWIASMGGGLVRFDGDTGETTNIDKIVGRSNAIGDPRVMALRQDRRGTLWIGTMGSGLRRLTPSGRLESIAVKSGDPRSLSDAGIMTIFEARDGRLWIGTHDGGANVLDPVTGLIRQLPYRSSAPGAISAAGVSAIAEDLNGNFWIGTDGGGLDLARPDGSVIRVFRHDPNDAASLPANMVYSLAVDAAGRVWIGTDGGGLALAVGSPSAPDSIRFQTVSRNEGLSSDTIWGVLTDAAGHLWLSGDAGLTRFDPESRAVKTFHREHGLQGEEFNYGAYFRLRDGRLCFGGPGGFNIFDPSRVSENRRPPRLVLTRLEVLGVPAPSATPYWLLDRILLDHRASVISLDFGALDFTSPKRNRIAYRMAGLTDRWIDLGSQHRISLTNLDAGDHVLEVRAANADSVWSETPLRLTIHREPAPWKSPWAYASYALAVLGLLVYRLRLQRKKFRQVVAAREHLQSEVALRTRELVESNRQLAEAAQAKANFLDRMSHELRTPMNGVVGMTELLSRTPLSSTQVRLTQTIRSSAQVLLQIVNDLLDLSKIQAGKVQLESLPIDLVPLMEECTSLFTGAADAKGIELVVCPPTGGCEGLIGDPLRLRQILMNLIGNAVKFTAQGEVAVKADLEYIAPDRAIVHISVADTGIGMDAATIAKIFEPFTQADESTTRRFGGSGLGLAICRELADLLGGAIMVESQPEVGSTFKLRLPLQVGTASGRQELAPLPPRTVHILARRPALAESLARHVSALGLTVSDDDRDFAARYAGREDVVIADAGNYQDYIRLYADSDPSLRPALVVVASAAEAQTAGLELIIDASTIVSKPAHREELYEALSIAVGAPRLTDAKTPAATETVCGGHVLLVEDEPVNAAVAEGYLSALGCTSVWVETGPEAIARSTAERFDLILMDLSMPTMDGFATTALIRQREGTGRRVPIVALTAHDAVNYRGTCLNAGMDDLLAKPYTLEECAQLLRRWIGSGAARPARETALLRNHDARSSVDPAAVASLRNLRPGKHVDLYSKLVDLFRAASTKSLAELRRALATDDLKAAADVCHKLASSAANVGALVFAKDVRLLGQICVAGDVVAAQQLHAELETAHPALLEELMRLQFRESA